MLVMALVEQQIRVQTEQHPLGDPNILSELIRSMYGRSHSRADIVAFKQDAFMRGFRQHQLTGWGG